MATRASTDFIKISEDILIKLSEIAENYNKQSIPQIQQVCHNFKIFYQEYYKQSQLSQQELLQHQREIAALIQASENIEVFSRFRKRRSINNILLSQAQKTRYLESLLTGFKTVFLKVIQQDFVQQIVIELQDGTPAIFETKDFFGLANFIQSSTIDAQGKLQQNAKMINSHVNFNSDLYNKVEIEEQYLNVYKQTRRRLNIFYDRIKKGLRQGEGLLLYRPGNYWIKFYVNNLGDVKQGLVNLIAHNGHLGSGIEKQVQDFAEIYIVQVDSVAGTLLQDVQKKIGQVIQQISVKSGSAKTGAHEGIIQLINTIADANVNQIYNLIADAFNIDKTKAESGSGRRNRVLENNDKDQQKLAQLLQNNCDNKVLQQIQKDISNIPNISIITNGII